MLKLSATFSRVRVNEVKRSNPLPCRSALVKPTLLAGNFRKNWIIKKGWLVEEGQPRERGKIESNMGNNFSKAGIMMSQFKLFSTVKQMYLIQIFNKKIVDTSYITGNY